MWIEICWRCQFSGPTVVTSYAEVWIEMISDPFLLITFIVTSYAEVWIEIL